MLLIHSIVKKNFKCKEFIIGAAHSLIYVANEDCPELNHTFDIYLEKMNVWARSINKEIIYIPALFKKLHDSEIQHYRMPWAKEIKNKNINIGNDYMLRYLSRKDRAKIKHGFLAFYEEKNDCTYYELCPHSEKDINEQLKAIAVWVEIEESYRFPCYRRDVEKIKPEDRADADFNSQYGKENTDDLMDEIRERIAVLRQRGVAQHLLEDLISPKIKLSRLVVTTDYRIILPDYQDMEIKMEPLAKAVYLLFIRHPEGIRFKELPDYRDELTDIYLKLKPNGMTDKTMKSIEDVTDPTLNSINEKCARIRGAFLGQFDDKLARKYYIDGFRGEPKRIPLSRKLVQWDGVRFNKKDDWDYEDWDEDRFIKY